MGTHPIFESDFDCLTDMSDQAEQDGTVGQKAEEPSMPVFHVYKFVCDFMAQNGWYVLFAIAVLCLLKKNLDSYFQKLQDWWMVAQIKKDPDTFQNIEEDRMSRIERLQKKLDVQAAAKKARQDEIDAARKEREEAARINGGGKESMARWEAEQRKKKGEPEPSTSNTIRDGPTKSGLKPKARLRGEYNPMTGSGGGTCKFTPGRKGPSRGG